MRLLGLIIGFLTKVFRRLMMYVMRPLFKKCGKRVLFSPFDYFTYETIELGDYVSIGLGACFVAKESGIKIGNKVMFGPYVSVRGGNHNTSVIGKYMYDVHEKRPEDDQPVIIEDDVWVGTNVTILKGVRIGRGSIIAAGAVVNKNVAPYSIVGGVPAKLIRMRWSKEEIQKHEEILYSQENRIDLNKLS
jgi:acetyltransferase-like isoleucine patch superfamily enzyme